MKKTELLKYLDDFLDNSKFTDGSKNGLQVDVTKNEIKKIWFAVDANTYIFDKAIKEKVDFLIVHHGLFWGFESTITWVQFERISKLIKNDIWLYGCHIPLDANKNIGNNWWLAKLLVEYLKFPAHIYEDFCIYHGNIIWVKITFSQNVELEKLMKFLESKWIKQDFYNFWNIKDFSTIWIVSGWGWEEILQLKNNDVDIFLTWEAAHFQMTYAKEATQSLILWGHYETETIGVKLLQKHLEDKFWVETVFIDEKY